MPHAATLTNSSPSPGRGMGVSMSSAPGAGRVLAIAFISSPQAVIYYDRCHFNTTACPPPSKARAKGEPSRGDTGMLGAGRSGPMTHRHAPIAHARAYQPVVGVLFEAVRDPTCCAAQREYRGRQPARKANHPRTPRQVEVEIGTQPLAPPHRLLDALRGLEQPPSAPARDLRGLFPQQNRARIAGGVDRVAEARR